MPQQATKGLRLERTFDCTPEELWAAWTDPAQYAKWLNPTPGMDLDIHEWDLREGGKIRFDMPQPNGDRNPQEGVFHTLEPYTRLVTGEPDRSFLLEVHFEAKGDRTHLVVLATGIPPEFREPAMVGWQQCFDKLESLVGAHQGALVITRVLDAPRNAVWAAWTDPKAFQQWWGPKGFTTPSSAIDLRVGGRYLHCMRSPQGHDMWTTGTFREIDSPHRLVMTHVLSDPEGNAVPHEGMEEPLVMTLTVTFDEQGDKTRITLRHAGMPPGDAQQGAGVGWQQAFDKLAAGLKAQVEA